MQYLNQWRKWSHQTNRQWHHQNIIKTVACAHSCDMWVEKLFSWF